MNKCLRPSSKVTKEQLREIHKHKMFLRAQRREYDNRVYADDRPILANISANHPRFGVLAKDL